MGGFPSPFDHFCNYACCSRPVREQTAFLSFLFLQQNLDDEVRQAHRTRLGKTFLMSRGR